VKATFAVSFALALAACGTAGGTSGSAPPTMTHPPATTNPSTDDYAPGVAADVHLPVDVGADAAVPVVVLVPGGAWLTADRAGLDPLARELASEGIFVVNATYRAASSGARFPTPVGDIVCAVAFAVVEAEASGLRPRPVVLVGHSSGAHLAALAALGDDHFHDGCAYPAATVDAFVGLAGVYDVALVPDVAEPLFGAGPGEAPDLWREGNPLSWVDARPSLPVFLAHGDADELVPLSFTQRFADALRAGGHPVDVEVVPGAGHHDLYAADVVAASIARWIASLP
jgi:acetyl esterase/lipase